MTATSSSPAVLLAALVQEKTARRLRRAGKVAEAITAYDNASTLYDDSGLAWDGNGETELAREVRRSIERCKKIASNLIHAKKNRPAATTPRPNCLDCGKPLRRYKINGKTFKNGTPREWGDYGDHRFCGLRCGWSWACKNSVRP